MDSLPAEIWEHIFYFACSDNGFTGRALSLVSHQMHDIVKPHMLRSIAIVGGAQIVKFSHFLTSISTSSCSSSSVSINCDTPPQTTVQNLFIGITNPRLFPPLTTSSDHLLRSALNSLSLDSSIPSPPTIPAVFGRRSTVSDRLIVVRAAIERILRLVAPTLHTLHFHFTAFDTLSSTPFPFQMPRLSELTIYGPLLKSFTDKPSTIPLLTIFPSLKRLRIGNFQGLPTDFLPRLAISMPQLTRISLFQPLTSSSHINSLERLITSPESFWPGETLERIIIEVDINSVLFEENTIHSGVDCKSRTRLLWLEKLRNCLHETADTRVRLIETHRSWVDVETAEMEWSKRNMGTRWAASFRTRNSLSRSSGISFEDYANIQHDNNITR
ncbi:hypothetical protein BYT27DRAFT_7195823 [Phlegmacium glaucopus]|nr:hypothetical protein BYT27DRAFT_7195823 [Phlegmacium glaucopus]